MAAINPYRYAGYTNDENTGLYYLMARYYDSGVGRFISRDAVQAVNLYVYCENNPVNMIDSSGYFAVNAVCAAVGAIAGWVFGDYVARSFGLSGAKYWAVRAGVVVGGAVIGWFAGAAIVTIVNNFLISNPSVAMKLAPWMLSGLGYAQRLASRVASSLGNYIVKSYHLMGGSGDYNKFATTNQSQIRSWIAEASTKGNNFVVNSEELLESIEKLTKSVKGQLKLEL